MYILCDALAKFLTNKKIDAVSKHFSTWAMSPAYLYSRQIYTAKKKKKKQSVLVNQIQYITQNMSTYNRGRCTGNKTNFSNHQGDILGRGNVV